MVGIRKRVHISDSLCCTLETNIILYVKYTSIKIKNARALLDTDQNIGEGQNNGLPKMFTSSPPEPVNVLPYRQKDPVGFTKLRILR